MHARRRRRREALRDPRGGGGAGGGGGPGRRVSVAGGDGALVGGARGAAGAARGLARRRDPRVPGAGPERRSVRDGGAAAGVVYEGAAARHPCLAPQDDAPATDEYWGSAQARDGGWRAAFAAVLAQELPQYCAAVGGADPDGAAVRGAAVGRRVTWIDLTSGRYDALGGRVALVGDAAHAMTPSLGEGCNTALESAAALVACVEAEPEGAPWAERLCGGFGAYGAARPGQVREVVHKSAAVSRAPPPKAPPPPRGPPPSAAGGP